MPSSRRTFLKVGGLAALALAAGGALWRATHPAPLQRFTVTGDAKAAIDAVIPVILHPLLPTQAQARAAAIATTTQRVHATILGMPLATQKELQDLFGLLALAPARRLLAGVQDDWPHAKAEDIAAFLQSWRLHRIHALRPGYYSLHDL